MQSLELDLDEQAGSNDNTRIERWSREDFIGDSMSSALQNDFDHGYIAEMCDEQEWDDSVVFECQNLIGGIGMTVCNASCSSILTKDRKLEAGNTALHAICYRRGSWIGASRDPSQTGRRLEQLREWDDIDGLSV